MYAVLKDFQSGMVGVLGFTGVMLTLWWNARLARIAREVTLEHERLTLRVALSQEMRILRSMLAPNIILLREGTGSQVIGPIPASTIYDTNISKIGTLTEKEVIQTVLCYSEVERLRLLNPTIGEGRIRNFIKLQAEDRPGTLRHFEQVVMMLDGSRETLEEFTKAPAKQGD